MIEPLDRSFGEKFLTSIDDGREARSIQFVKFETMFDRPLEAIRDEYGLGRDCSGVSAMPTRNCPGLLAPAA